MDTAARLQAILAKPFTPAVFFFAGVSYDTITLTRIDQLFDNLILMAYLGLLGLLIVMIGRQSFKPPDVEEDLASMGAVPRLLARGRPYYRHAIQFLLGGLFSAYAIFYLQSASLTTTAIFFGVLMTVLVANEFFRDRLSSLKLLVGLYALVCFSFFTYFLPVLVRFMNTFIFLLGAFLSLAVALWVVELILKGSPNQSRKEKVLTGLPAVVLVGVMVGFYFLNWIPPVPLSLKFGGFYHEIVKRGDVYGLGFEEAAWYDFLKRSDDPFHGEGPVYCFTAVFAPVDLETTIFHHWRYRTTRPDGEEQFLSSDRISIPISGGREGGYRAYTVKQHLTPGDWQVDVETETGRLIGRVAFRVEEAGKVRPQLQTLTY